MLIGFIALYLDVGSFDFLALAELGAKGKLIVGLGAAYPFVFFAIMLGLWVKVPLFPLHLWQPAAYAEAPTAVSMLLTGVLSKMGVYAFLRIIVPLFPDALRDFSETLLNFLNRFFEISNSFEWFFVPICIFILIKSNGNC